jgi:nitrogen fixation NifU-like protein
MDRQEQIEILVDHFRNPRHQGVLEDADVTMPGGNPGCGDVITVYLKVGEDGKPVADVAWEGEGCTISQAAASILMEMVHDEEWSMEDILDHDYNTMIDILGKEAVQMRPKCATLALGTLKAAVRKYQRDQLRASIGAEANAPLPEDEGIDEIGIVVGEAALKEKGNVARRRDH